MPCCSPSAILLPLYHVASLVPCCFPHAMLLPSCHVVPLMLYCFPRTVLLPSCHAASLVHVRSTYAGAGAHTPAAAAAAQLCSAADHAAASALDREHPHADPGGKGSAGVGGVLGCLPGMGSIKSFNVRGKLACLPQHVPAAFPQLPSNWHVYLSMCLQHSRSFLQRV
eukprot:661373-Pelagomonas_calceolata.AAC.3